MTRLYTLLIALFLTSSALAQTPFSSVSFPVNNINHLTAETNQAGDVCIVAFGHLGTDFLILDDQGKKVSTGNYPYNFANGSTILGMIGLPDRFIYFDETPNAPGTVQPYKVDRQTGQVIMLNSVVAVPDKNSILTTAFSANGRFYALFLNRKANILYVSIFKDEHTPEVRTYSLNSFGDKQMYGRLVKRGDLQLMLPGVDQNMYSNSAFSKIYASPDKLMITFDMFDNPDAPKYSRTTEILTLDLKQDKATFQQLPYLTIGRGLIFNSYLHQNKIYRFVVSNLAIQLEVHDLAANKLLKHYSYSQQDSIGIMVNDAIKIGTPDSWSPQAKSIKTTKKLFSKFEHGIPAIAVDTLTFGKLQLMMGTYHVQESRAATIGGAATRRAAVFGGPAALPLILLGAALQGTSITMTEGVGVSTYFQSILSSDNFETAPDNLRKSIQEKMSDYERLLYTQKVRPAGAVVYTYQGKAYFGYLDKETKLLNIAAFSKNY
ncbi:hypothetical protein H8S95_10210 [Pontibacter sp. KCTC 32443]|uniref:hypothetical protein n=1 Tax=Pontibacter TaxID=323449 RepID=UPI00164D1B38|nr:MULTISPECIES: hypothetical protein [Pontibacter]MBC5774435.1 hypothetical protein [Pontibacter sp. KCTC 32443]